MNSTRNIEAVNTLMELFFEATMRGDEDAKDRLQMELAELMGSEAPDLSAY